MTHSRVARLLRDGVRLHQEGDRAGARERYERTLELSPGQPDALHFLGVLSHQEQRSDEAVRLIRSAIAACPTVPDMHSNLGNVLLESKRFDEAIAAYGRALEIDPRSWRALHGLGVALREAGEPEAGLRALDEAVSIQPADADSHHDRGRALRSLGRLEEAAAALRRAIELEPDHERAHVALAHVLTGLGRRDAMRDVLASWMRREPDNPVAAHLLAAFSGEAIPARAADAYVERVFDEFADHFDANLQDLGYRGPRVLGEVLRDALGEPTGSLVVLDAGCGTGLLGPTLRPWADRLVGVDLSERMLAHARERGLHDECLKAEIGAHLAASLGAYDLIVCADTLVYFGDLEPFMRSAALALRPGGHLAFTVEADPGEPSAGHRLGHSGRYMHGRAHVESALELAGLGMLALDPAVLRTEGGEPVRSLVGLAARPPEGPSGRPPDRAP